MSTPVELPAAAVIFDIDDTLVDFHGAAMRALDDATAELRSSLGLASDSARRAWASINDAEYSRYLTGELDFDAMRYSRMSAVLGLLDPDGAGAWDHVAIENQRNGSIFDHYQVFPDVPQTLEALRAEGIAIGVISNSDGDYQRRKLRAVGLDEFVDDAILSGDVGVSKPHAAIFHLAAEQLGVQPAHAVYVGDRWFTDAVGALRAGLGAVWLNRKGIDRPAAPAVPEDGEPLTEDPTVGRVFAEVSALTEVTFRRR